MPVRIHYIPLPGGEENNDAPSQEALRRQRQVKILKEYMHKLENYPGGLEFLRLRCEKENGFAYYSKSVGGILADFMNKETLEDCPREITNLTFEDFNNNQSMQVCHLKAGLLKEDEYNRLKNSVPTTVREILEDLPTATIASFGTTDACSFHGDGGTVYGIPVFRCAWDADWKEPEKAGELLLYLIRKGFLPDFGRIIGMDPDEVWRQLKGAKTVDLPPVLRADPKGNEVEQKRWEKIMNFYCRTGFRTANLAIYPESMLLGKGSWELHPYAGLNQELLEPKEGPWCEVSGLYARNPREDLAPDAEYVAIDFGTTSTVAAIYQDNGCITTMPVGGGQGAGQIGNPTILKFIDLGSFLNAYEKKPFRPDTEFLQVSTSHSAQADFESPKREHVLQYLNQLKQWVNDPNRPVSLRDRNSGRDITLGKEMKADTFTVDPIELYAYYIGLSLNDMRWGKIYQKYLLSYSATYSEYSREWIRSSFERGLSKSLPPEVGKDTQPEVQLWQDEATCYAICAVRRILLADEETYQQEEPEKGIFYGIYDFGGGTLDFSFGVMDMDPATEVQHFRQLRCGGSPIMGCENILDNLAFEIFSQNHKKFQEQNRDIKCSIPIGADPRQYFNSPIAGESEAARYNTCSLTAYLRKKWIGSGKNSLEEEEMLDTLKLVDEHGKSYEWVGRLGSSGADTIEMDISEEEIEKYFVEKVDQGIALFLDCWKTVVSDKKCEAYRSWPCHIFLAGSASQASRVLERFRRMARENGNSKSNAPTFICHPPLPTDADKKSREKNIAADIPTAKSGVAYGLLLSRPGAEDIVIEKDARKVGFHYHIGRRVKSAANGGKGMFRFLLEKAEMPEYEEGTFKLLREIPQQIFELLYTFDDSYVLVGGDQKVNGSVRVLSLRIPEECSWEGKNLYIRAMPSSDTVAELGISFSKEDLAEHTEIEVIGECNFARGIFVPKVQMAQMSGSKRETLPHREEEKASFPQKPSRTSPQSSHTDDRDYSLGILPADSEEPVWKIDMSKAREKTYFGDFETDGFVLCFRRIGEEQWGKIPVTLKGNGAKRVFVVKEASGILSFSCATAQREKYTFTVDIHTKEVGSSVVS